MFEQETGEKIRNTWIFMQIDERRRTEYVPEKLGKLDFQTSLMNYLI